jgi:Histidine kinase
LCWSVLYFGIKSYESQRKQEQAMLKAVALAQEAQLKMLRYQLNPHFLFNTLNAISTLILDNQNRKANHAIARLSEFLRYTLGVSRYPDAGNVRLRSAGPTGAGVSAGGGVRHSLQPVRHPGVRGAGHRLPAEADRRCALCDRARRT